MLATHRRPRLLLLAVLALARADAGAGFADCGYLIAGVECLLLRTTSGQHLVLDDLGGFRAGDWVWVSGALDPACVTICMQGQGCLLGNTISTCPVPAAMVAPPVLLRNDDVTTLDPPTLRLADIFTGSTCGSSFDPAVTLDPPGPDCQAVAGWGDDDDTHYSAFTSGVADFEEGILVDSGRPLVFYQVDSDPVVGNGLRCTKDYGTESVTITF